MSANYPGDKAAQEAFDVMMRRGWMSQVDNKGFWFPIKANGQDYPPGLISWRHQPFSDPFTCLVEADKWYKENVEVGNDA